MTTLDQRGPYPGLCCFYPPDATEEERAALQGDVDALVEEMTERWESEGWEIDRCSAESEYTRGAEIGVSLQINASRQLESLDQLARWVEWVDHEETSWDLCS